MVTPSGWAQNGLNSDSCTHSSTELVGQKDATCSQEGYTGDVRCTTCKAVITKGYSIPKLSHSFDDGKITKNPSHLEEGILTYTCFGCGATKTEVLAKNSDHAYGNWTADSDGINHTGSCVCGEVKKETHTFDTGTVTKPATHIEAGVLTYSCHYCEYTYTEEIPRITEHTFTEWTPDADGTTHKKT